MSIETNTFTSSFLKKLVQEIEKGAQNERNKIKLNKFHFNLTISFAQCEVSRTFVVFPVKFNAILHRSEGRENKILKEQDMDLNYGYIEGYLPAI